MAHDELKYFLDQGGDAQSRAISPDNQIAGANLGNGGPSAPPANAPTLPTDINDSKVQMPTNESLNFTPTGPGTWDVVKQHPFAAVPAALTGLYSRFLDKPDNYSGNFHNDQADAYRHARWSQTLSNIVGPDTAKQFTDAYERSNPNPDSERLMDLYNNQVGRGLSSLDREKTEEALKKGELRTSPFKKW